jgi:hypothetical protein
MTEDQRIRSAVRTLIEAAPPAPPFPVAGQRRFLPPVRAVLAIATACLVGAGALVAVSSRNGSDRVNTLVIAGKDGAASGRFSLVNIDTREAHDVNVPGMGLWGDSQYPIVHTGSRLVYFENRDVRSFPPSVRRKVYSFSDRFRGRVITLGRADVVVPSARRGYIWLVQRQNNFRYDVNVSEVDAASPEARPRSWPIKGEPIFGVDGGLLVEIWNKDHDEIAVWKPGSGTRTLLSSRAVAGTANDGTTAFLPGALLFGGLSGESAVVGAGCDQYQTCSALKIVNINTGEARTVPRPPGIRQWVVGQDIPRHALSPAGNHIVIPAKPDNWTSGGYPRIVIDLHGRVLRRFNGVAASALWSDDGEWVIVQQLESLVAYRPKDGTTRTMRLHYNGPIPITLPGSIWDATDR